MESANPSCSTSNREFLDPKKKEEIESWLGDSRIVDSFDVANEIEYFDTFPTLEELEYHEWLLKYPKPSWVKAKIRTGNLNNIKISCKIGHFLKRQAYIDLESPINVMSKQHYNKIMNKGLESRQKSPNHSKNNNFVGRVKGLKVFIGNFTYECNFMILEDTTSIINHHLGEVVFRKPFARNTSLVYDQKKGTVTFEKDDDKITFVMPHKMIDFKDINTDSIPSSVLESNDDRGKTYYSDSLTLGPEYREDESISNEIRHLMKLEREAKRYKKSSHRQGGVTLSLRYKDLFALIGRGQTQFTFPGKLGVFVYFTFGRNLEELHVTWSHLEKKQTRLRTYTNISQDNVLRSWRRRHRYNVTPSQ
ncbi:protein kinase-like domain, concanavalin A-like lectin/glucanase domain protein [Tanacetum coccineum]